MTIRDELFELEKGFWSALGDPEYYRKHMAKDGLAVFGEPHGVMGKDEAIAETSKTSGLMWTDVRLDEPRVVELGRDSAILVYKGSAKRDGEPYSACCSSVYVRRGGNWQLALHQQSVPMQVPAAARS